MSWSTFDIRVRLAPWNRSKPSSKISYWLFQGGTYFVDHLCFLCLVFLMLSRLFIAALWSPAGKGLTSWLLLVMFIVFLLVSNVVSWVRCGTSIVSWHLPSFLLSLATSRYRALSTESRTWPCMEYEILIGRLDLVMCTTWHLDGLNSCSISRSFWCFLLSACP